MNDHKITKHEKADRNYHLEKGKEARARQRQDGSQTESGLDRRPDNGELNHDGDTGMKRRQDTGEW